MEHNMWQAMTERHSVRTYTARAIDPDARQALLDCIEACRRESGLSMRLVLDAPGAFDNFMAHYGKFSGVTNYIALSGGPDEACGYYGERVVLRAQTLGLNTCWVAMSYSKGQVRRQLGQGQPPRIVIALGYGADQGKAHRSKRPEQVSTPAEDAPAWFKKGVEAALLAPTAMNQQRFFFTLRDNAVSARAGVGFYTKIDLGIAKYHFELGAGRENFHWATS